MGIFDAVEILWSIHAKYAHFLAYIIPLSSTYSLFINSQIPEDGNGKIVQIPHYVPVSSNESSG